MQVSSYSQDYFQAKRLMKDANGTNKREFIEIFLLLIYHVYNITIKEYIVIIDYQIVYLD